MLCDGDCKFKGRLLQSRLIHDIILLAISLMVILKKRKPAISLTVSVVQVVLNSTISSNSSASTNNASATNTVASSSSSGGRGAAYREARTIYV
jgi:hypothetical protein